MKKAGYQRRSYREHLFAKGLYSAQVVYRETDLQIFSDKPPDVDFCEKRIILYRAQIEKYITRDNKFLTSLKPVPVEISAPLIVKRMARSAELANVGPMAAVAGAIADFLGRDLLRRGSREVIVENGGDIFLKLSKTRKIGFYTGARGAWRSLALKIRPQDTPLGICTSSGTIGHSLSFGAADSVTILSSSACLADAAATAVCNRTVSLQEAEGAIDFAGSIKGVSAAIVIFGKRMFCWGRLEFFR
ncbi:MAG: UPF0280 family protein [Candidatus Omnitrophica bacterium]|nr:UPF0280 family protein [Candidatus Omnitrophota bacterium]MDD5512188.1 UPF0280 family protein [Candidatus Omnitrophota bacterium]